MYPSRLRIFHDFDAGDGDFHPSPGRDDAKIDEAPRKRRRRTVFGGPLVIIVLVVIVLIVVVVVVDAIGPLFIGLTFSIFQCLQNECQIDK